MTTNGWHDPADRQDSNESGRSQHPIDNRIREMVHGREVPNDVDVNLILGRIAAAPFDDRVLPVRLRHRGLQIHGHTLGAREPALTIHMVQRVLEEKQWVSGTTADRYVADLRDAVRAPEARLVVYHRRDGYIAGVFSPNTLPLVRRGPGAEDWMYVVYAVDRGMIISGYQASGLHAISIPGDARWLR